MILLFSSSIGKHSLSKKVWFIYLIKLNYTSYNYTLCYSTWTCLSTSVIFWKKKMLCHTDHFSIQSIGCKSCPHQIQLWGFGHFKWPSKQTLSVKQKRAFIKAYLKYRALIPLSLITFYLQPLMDCLFKRMVIWMMIQF